MPRTRNHSAPRAAGTRRSDDFADLLEEVRRCRACVDLPHQPRPVLAASGSSRIVVVGQAPGARVHASGVPWSDESGRELLRWLEVDESRFRDPRCFALLPMGFCFPGRGPGGDLPPRPECAPLWQARLLARMPKVRLTLLVGRYALGHFLGEAAGSSVTETVRRWREFPPGRFPLPHPSPRNRPWRARNPWFEEEVLPVLRSRVRAALAGD